jgi:hypothetical protein
MSYVPSISGGRINMSARRYVVEELSWRNTYIYRSDMTTPSQRIIPRHALAAVFRRRHPRPHYASSRTYSCQCRHTYVAPPWWSAHPYDFLSPSSLSSRQTTIFRSRLSSLLCDRALWLSGWVHSFNLRRTH